MRKGRQVGGPFRLYFYCSEFGEIVGHSKEEFSVS
jgi:hypothetical protein